MHLPLHSPPNTARPTCGNGAAFPARDRDEADATEDVLEVLEDRSAEFPTLRSNGRNSRPSAFSSLMQGSLVLAVFVFLFLLCSCRSVEYNPEVKNDGKRARAICIERTEDMSA